MEDVTIRLLLDHALTQTFIVTKVKLTGASNGLTKSGAHQRKVARVSASNSVEPRQSLNAAGQRGVVTSTLLMLCGVRVCVRITCVLAECTAA